MRPRNSGSDTQPTLPNQVKPQGNGRKLWFACCGDLWVQDFWNLSQTRRRGILADRNVVESEPKMYGPWSIERLNCVRSSQIGSNFVRSVLFVLRYAEADVEGGLSTGRTLEFGED